MEEVVRRLTDTGALIGERGAYTLTIAPEDIGIPLSVQSIIATRVDALPAPAKRVLQSAAVLAQPVTASLLMAMSELSADMLREAVRQIEDAGFLTPVRMNARHRIHLPPRTDARSDLFGLGTRPKAGAAWQVRADRLHAGVVRPGQ